MACIIRGQIDQVVLQDIILSIFFPLSFKIIEDISEIAEQGLLNFDSYFEVCYVSNPTESWTILQTLFGGNDLSFEFEEYLADQLNQQYNWVTVADNYRLMADHLRGDVSSGYYSILFEQNHSVYLVDNSTFDDETNRLLFTKIACISPPSAQTIIKDSYQFAEYAQQPYIGYKLEDDVFYPVMKSEYLVLQLSDLLQRWHKDQS